MRPSGCIGAIESPGRRAGRPRSSPIGLQRPQIVPMTAAQQEIAVQSLAVLLDSWLERANVSPGRTLDVVPKTRDVGDPWWNSRSHRIVARNDELSSHLRSAGGNDA